ncbi:Tetratricopeptide TPR_2 repeat protein [Minicystis rosea]|nr:Tetratricopeptide TPR_2 repeat protein [Minicystis rosea]
MSRSRTPIVAASLLAILSGCQLLIGLDGGIAGSGGSGGSGGTSTSSGDTTSSTSSGTTCDAASACEAPTDCPDPMNECVTRACQAGCCVIDNVSALTPIAAQTAGDCKKEVCNGSGATASVVDDTDAPAGQDACHQGGCNGGEKTQTPMPAGTKCSFSGGKVCGDPAGAHAGLCVECNDAADCATGQVCAAGTCSALVLLATNGTDAFGATYQPAGTWGAPVSLGGASTDEPALAFTTTGTAVGAYRIPMGAPASEQVWFATWATGSWATAKAISATSVFARSAPSVSAGNGTLQLVFHGTDYKHYYAAFTGGAWSPLADPVGGATPSFGPMPAAIAALGNDAAVVFFDGAGENHPTAQDHMGSAWQSKVTLDSSASATSMPSVVAMKGGASSLLVVYPRADGSIVYQTRPGTTWSAAAPIGNASTNTTGRVALAALPGGQAIMAFQGTDNYLYYAKYDGIAWTGPTAFATPNVAVATVPVLAPGLGGATAEMAFVKASDGLPYHARLVGNAWTAPVAVGSQVVSHVAMASWP